jgi:hypothetical protein
MLSHREATEGKDRLKKKTRVLDYTVGEVEIGKCCFMLILASILLVSQRPYYSKTAGKC